MSRITIYTDGAFNPTTQCGSWAVVIHRGDGREILTGTVENTTSSCMELTAVIQALESIEPAGQRIEIRSDSEYVVRGVNQWLPGWVRNGWVTSRGKAVANRDLWQQVCRLLARHSVRITWVPRRKNVADPL